MIVLGEGPACLSELASPSVRLTPSTERSAPLTEHVSEGARPRHTAHGRARSRSSGNNFAPPRHRTTRAHSRPTRLSAIASVVFTQNIQRHVQCPATAAPGATVREVLDAVFEGNPRARGYVLDDQGALRVHMVIFVDGRQVRDRRGLSDAVSGDGEVYVMQALSGG
jgi:molybdopterin synthase sulfur carrier subunit